MTQAAKAQEPSMEEILASIRRIIADDETKPGDIKPAANDAGASSAKADAASARPPVMSGIPPSQLKVAQPASAKPAAPPPATAVSNNQDDIDAMLADLDAGTAEADVRPAQAEPDEVFELTEQMAVDAPSSADAGSDVEFTEPAPPPVAPQIESRPQPAAQAWRPAPTPQQTSAAPGAAPVMSQSTIFAVESAFNSLANTVLSNNARTLEDLVKEMLRPMLKSWLDDNLPGLVERLVRTEIERVSRGNPR